MSNIEQQNNKIKERLLEIIKGSNLSHAYLFAGGSGAAREELAMWFSQAILCDSHNAPCMECLSCRKFSHGNHEDFVLIKKESDRETISAEQINALVDELAFKPFGDKHVVVIQDAQLMNASSQNKFLKTLEEPISKSVIILLSDKEGDLLPTMSSRCIKFHLEDVSSDTNEMEPIAQLFTNLLLEGAPYYKKKLAVAAIISNKDNDRSQAALFLDTLEEKLINLLKEEIVIHDTDKYTKLSNAINQTEICRKNLRQLHNVSYSLKQLCLNI